MTTQPVYYEEYIKNITWESNPMLYTNDNLAAYYAAVRLINGDKPIEESIDYNSPIWDYNRPVGDNYNQTTIAYGGLPSGIVPLCPVLSNPQT